MRFLLPLFLALSVALGTANVHAAGPVQLAQASGGAPAQPSGQATAQAPALTPEAAARLRALLADEKKRQELIKTLDALAAAGAAMGAANGAAAAPAAGNNTAAAPGAATPAAPAGEAPAAEAPAGAPAAESESLLAPDTIGGQLLHGASQRLQALSDQLVNAARSVTDLPGLVSWASGVARDPVTQTRVFDASWKLLLLFTLALLAEHFAKRGIRRWRERLDGMAPEAGSKWRWLRKVPLVLARFFLDLGPVLAFAVVSYGMIGVVKPLPTTELVLLTANNAYIVYRALMLAARMLLSPNSAHLRLLPVSDETAAYITVWLARIVAVSVVGYAVTEAGLLFGLPWGVYDALQRLVLLIVSLFFVIIVLQNRLAVADLLRAPELKEGEEPTQGRRLLRGLRDRMAEVWHFLAILYLLALWAVWALEIHDGFVRLLRSSLLTLAILALAKGFDVALRRGITRGFRVGPELASRYPGLEVRANRYLPVFKGIITGVVTLVAILFLLETWGIDAFNWFGTGRLGNRVLGAVVSIGLTMIIAVAVWEMVNAAIQRHLEKLARDAKAARSARVRTLLPMLRTALLIFLLVVVAFNVLTAIGINVAPLLAGAGVIGLAIGFGSQKLVQDVITGIFLLMEDAVAVGDSVNLGGKGGVVEQLSIRSIRLRDGDGAVHIIPFSAVTTVTNSTRDFGFAMIDVTVGYNQDTDQVAEALRELVKEMRSEVRWGAVIRDDFDLWGVDQLGQNGVVMRGRVKTDAGQRWPVQRELYGRIKRRFAEMGIIIAPPSTTVMLERRESEAAAHKAAEGE
ncbi:mechanosensitive ion channel [Acetobacteraceae bacterium H6797]|nr:mechanosensitive ion channel [Acetobacteraceae bacterium H6797]